jgi:NAD+ diphosphatase
MADQTSVPALARGTVDRCADRRRDPDWLADAWRTGAVLVLDDARRALVDADTQALVLVGSDTAPEGERFFLGVDPDGVACWAVAADLLPRRLGARPSTLREVGALLPDRDAELFAAGQSLANWHATHPRCPRCGEPTVPEQAGWVRRCVADGSEHFPRTDPAVIMLVHDGADHCLLGRQAMWPPRMWSTLAGFVEPGESAEQAVRREVCEEAGAEVRDVVYRGSQPWPYPASLMLGFEAIADVGPLTVDPAELEDARWFSRDEVEAQGFGMPSATSIAQWLIAGWLARS